MLAACKFLQDHRYDTALISSSSEEFHFKAHTEHKNTKALTHKKSRIIDSHMVWTSAISVKLPKIIWSAEGLFISDTIQ